MRKSYLVAPFATFLASSLVVVSLGVFTLGALALAAQPAAAHTERIQSSPGPTQEVGGVVDFVDFVFAAPITDLKVTLEDPNGDLVAGTVTVPDGQLVRYEMPALTVKGRYLLRYDLISDDGDETFSQYWFNYHPDFVQPLRLGNAEVPSSTRNIVTIVASVILGVCLIGMSMVFLSQLERRRAAEIEASDESDPEKDDAAKNAAGVHEAQELEPN